MSHHQFLRQSPGPTFCGSTLHQRRDSEPQARWGPGWQPRGLKVQWLVRHWLGMTGRAASLGPGLVGTCIRSAYARYVSVCVYVYELYCKKCMSSIHQCEYLLISGMRSKNWHTQQCMHMINEGHLKACIAAWLRKLFSPHERKVGIQHLPNTGPYSSMWQNKPTCTQKLCNIW